jgi:hypothetical protein
VDAVLFVVVCVTLWLFPALLLRAVTVIARHSGIDLRRSAPPPDDIDYQRW